jgi:hypothetical protein
MTDKHEIIGSEQVNNKEDSIACNETDTFFAAFKSRIKSDQNELSLNNKMLNFLKNSYKY